MKTSVKIIVSLIFAFMLAMSCNSDDNALKMDDDVSQTDDDPTPTDDDPGPAEGYEMVDVQVILPDGSNADTTGASLFGMGATSNLDDAAKGNIPFNPGSVELAYLFDADGDLLLAGFMTDERKEVSVATTAEVMLYFGMLTSLRTTPYKKMFVERIVQEQAFMDLAAEFETLFNQNPKVFAEGGFMDALNEAITSLTSKEPIDIGSKIDFGPIESSGLSLDEAGEQSFTVSNSYPRRAHGFVYKKSYKDEFGNETVINSEIEGSDTPDHELEIPFIALANENQDDLQGQVTNFNLCSQGARYASKTSSALNLELVEGRASETYELAVIGPGSGGAAGRGLTNAEQEKFEELSVETFIMDYFLPILMDIGGNRDTFETKALQGATSMVGTVEPILRAHEPSITAVLDNDFETAMNEFLPFLYGDIRLSNDLRNIMTQMYGILSTGSSPNTFIQNNELIQEGEQRYLKLTSAILRSIKESVGINCINQRLGVSAKLEKWDITISEGVVKLQPEKMTTVPFGDPKEIRAKVLINLEEGEELEYEWSTTTQFGGVLNDYNGQDGTSFTTASDKVAFFSNASATVLGDGENLEEVTVIAYLKSGSSRDELGTATMTVDVKKKKFEIKPDGITIKGDDEVNLKLVHNDGETAIPNAETEYKVVWSTNGSYGLLNGISTTITTLDDGSMSYEAQDTEVESATEIIKAEVYARPKGSDQAYALADEAEATLTIENDDQTLIYYVDIGVDSHRDQVGIYHNAQVWSSFKWNTNEALEDIPDGFEVERYTMRIIERTPDVIPSCSYTSDTWTPQELEGGSEGSELELRCPVGAISGPNSANVSSWMSEALARYASAKGYAQVTVYLKPKS